MDTLDRMREDANNWIVGDLSYTVAGQGRIINLHSWGEGRK